MGKAYESLRQVVQGTLNPSKGRFVVGAQTSGPTFNDEVEKLEQILVDKIDRLKAIVTEGEAVVVAEAQETKEVIDGLRENIGKLEAAVRETEETIRQKDIASRTVEERLSGKIHALQTEVKEKERTLKMRGDEISDLQSEIDAQTQEITRLELAIQNAKGEAAADAKRVEELMETSRVKITAGENHFRELQERVRERESTLTALEHNASLQLSDMQSQLEKKEKLLIERDRELKDLKAQLQKVVGEINKISSFFEHAEALTSIETQDARTFTPGELKRGKETSAPTQLGEMNSSSPSTDDEIVSPDLFERLARELTPIMGAMSHMIILHDVAALGESIDKFPKRRIVELLDSVTKELPAPVCLALWRTKFTDLK